MEDGWKVRKRWRGLLGVRGKREAIAICTGAEKALEGRRSKDLSLFLSANIFADEWPKLSDRPGPAMALDLSCSTARTDWNLGIYDM